MKVIFKVIKAGSGNDVYFQRLSEALKKINIESEIEYYPKYFQYAPWLLKYFKKQTPGDIIHSNVEYGHFFKENDKPLIVSLLHNVFEADYQQHTSVFQKIFHYLILKRNIEQSLKRADKVIAISEYTKKSFEETFKTENIKVIYCCLDTDLYRPEWIPSSDKRFKLLFVGNLTWRKGADLLPGIMKGLGNDFVLYYTSGLRTEIPNEFKQSNMIPLGKLSEKKLIEEYNKCDVLIAPTRLEGFGYSLAEAMACSKPVVATNCSSIPEIVENSINGYLCEQDNISQFIDSINKLNKKSNLARMKKINREVILNKFDYKHGAHPFKDIYS